MTTHVRKFLPTWEVWVERWHDPSLQPFHAPFFLAERGREVFVGPFVSPRGEVRDRIVPYPSWHAAARDYHLQQSDFVNAYDWLTGIETAMPEVVPEVRALIQKADQLLHELPAYTEAMLRVTWLLLADFARIKGHPEQSDLLKAKIAERDKFVERSALEVMKRMRLGDRP